MARIIHPFDTMSIRKMEHHPSLRTVYKSGSSQPNGRVEFASLNEQSLSVEVIISWTGPVEASKFEQMMYNAQALISATDEDLWTKG